nr:immunoglobulin heavy chain junction region [Macaca mulatta]MPO14367.1 immunoglobulin heavy chain junction region [Macaca mulatta]MPO14368.1 immunoglobulin heavy chain junction region [Macaca mulatta]MPO14371.1 immunoglobulin heavy chain junction region [Macaca mulatta]MPO14372.1 immunoglobulin heavy chain junction region [Macaca mulatta]
CTRDGLRIFW